MGAPPLTSSSPVRSPCSCCRDPDDGPATRPADTV
jgi:hypothetical protein